MTASFAKPICLLEEGSVQGGCRGLGFLGLRAGRFSLEFLSKSG